MIIMQISNNIFLFSIPVVNLITRREKENQYFEAATRNLTSVSRLLQLNAERKKFQKDYLIGMGIQAIVAISALALKILFPLPSRIGAAAILAFACFSLNANISLPMHFILGNVTISVNDQQKSSY